MNAPIKVGVLGAAGRMGRGICDAVRQAPDLELAAAVHRDDPLDRLAGVDVAVDVTTPQAVISNVEWTIAHGVHTVIGTSGIGTFERQQIEQLVAQAPGVGVHIVPNFSIAALLAMQLAAKAAPYFDDVEIVEFAGRHKKDAPSGTAEQTARLIAEARTGTSSPTPAPSAFHGEPVHGIPVHSVRMAGLLSSQNVHLSRAGELLSIRFETLDRSAFMPGVLLAIRKIITRPGLTVGLEALLNDEERS